MGVQGHPGRLGSPQGVGPPWGSGVTGGSAANPKGRVALGLKGAGHPGGLGTLGGGRRGSPGVWVTPRDGATPEVPPLKPPDLQVAALGSPHLIGGREGDPFCSDWLQPAGFPVF